MWAATPTIWDCRPGTTYFAPRVGFAYRISEKTVVRGGFGISYTPFEDNTYAYNYPVRANNGYNAANSYMPAVLNTSTGACSTTQTYFTFECGMPAPVPVTIPSNGIITANTSQLLSQSEFYIPLNYHNPYVESWNIAIQQALPKQFNMQLSYVGNHGTRMGVGQNINLASALNQGAAGYPLNIAFGKTVSVTEDFLGYSTNYSSLQAELNRHFTGNLGVTTSFTWGKGLNYATGGDDDGGLYFWLDQRHSYAPTDFDHRFNFEESVSWILPFGPHQKWLNSGAVASILGGWQLSGVVSAYSGLPMNITASGTNINTSGENQMANITGGFHASQGHWSRTQLVQHLGLLAARRVAPAPWGPRALWCTGRASATSAGTRTAGRDTFRTTHRCSRPSPCTKTGRSNSAAMHSSSPTRRSSTARPAPSPVEPLGKSPARSAAVPGSTGSAAAAPCNSAGTLRF